MCLYVAVKADRTTALASGLWQPPERWGGGQKQAGEGDDEVSKDSCIAQFGPYLHFNKSAEVKCLNSQEN